MSCRCEIGLPAATDAATAARAACSASARTAGGAPGGGDAQGTSLLADAAHYADGHLRTADEGHGRLARQEGPGEPVGDAIGHVGGQRRGSPPGRACPGPATAFPARHGRPGASPGTRRLPCRRSTAAATLSGGQGRRWSPWLSPPATCGDRTGCTGHGGGVVVTKRSGGRLPGHERPACPAPLQPYRVPRIRALGTGAALLRMTGQ